MFELRIRTEVFEEVNIVVYLRMKRIGSVNGLSVVKGRQLDYCVLSLSATATTAQLV